MEKVTFRTENGVLIRLLIDPDEMSDSMQTESDGRVFLIHNGRRIYPAELTVNRQRTDGNWKEPLLSDALGVMPNQIQEATEHAAKHGVPTEFVPARANGQGCQAILRNRGHRRRLMDLYGYHDRDGGYSDG